MQNLKNFLQSNLNVNTIELDDIISEFREKTYEKGQLVLKRGQIANYYYFVSEGALRFELGDDAPLTAWIVEPGEFFTEITSYNPQKPTRFNIEAVTQTTVYCINKASMERLFEKYASWQQFGRKLWETMAMRMIDEIISFQVMTVEERYLQFLKRPGFMQLISVKQLASYLGITPNALSRIRKNLR
ncbi:Crp/Fnr family transcriptional regulator [Mucilaginibacter aquatilis]|uniref:Cyclic nucleotide-binding domain-containing protein n=1 Tax=Mucilaginibacter aquatilis TaxID=1517760 RepID=A0A6I4I8P8_9SPHI|nr:Crp/Fnr family transcriptional regulator [Mucilaginibacter aquatilis]MVN91287.1 cyclic nucleotide-binding domain-containing protein [Mucilaginibacter aquatilis]